VFLINLQRYFAESRAHCAALIESRPDGDAVVAAVVLSLLQTAVSISEDMDRNKSKMQAQFAGSAPHL
jgi:hypothetical protein